MAGDLPDLASLEPVPLPALLTLTSPGAGHRDHGQAPALLTGWSGSRSGNGPIGAKVIKCSPVPEC